jgi:putative radical SAM enzyme (TIGR03279 family)
MKNNIVKVLKNSIAEELELEPGDELISVNNCEIVDYIDYKFQISDDTVLLKIMKKDGELWEFDIEKEYDEDLGIIFENPLMDNIKVCSNNCIFCFIDQMPRGMRKTLYLKDDDTRLSFLYGNFITLTNLSEDEIRRIIRYRISPIKVSVHTTDSDLRKFMMGNDKDVDIIKYLSRLTDAGITVDCQVVLVKDVNDGKVLDKTIRDLSKLHPNLRSVAVVPVGLTDFRDKLFEIKPFDKESSSNLVQQVTVLQDEMYSKLKTRFVFIADEFYITSGKKFPHYREYENFDQLENGIGLCRLFEWEIDNCLKKIEFVEKKENNEKEITIVTGVAAYDLLSVVSKKIMKKVNVKINVEKIVNNFFGEKITVAGLVTGKDIIKQLKHKDCGQILIPSCMLNDENGVFLDDLTVEDLEKELKTKVNVLKVDGEELINFIMQ